MKAAGNKGPAGEPEVLTLKNISWPERFRLAAKNPALAGRLAAWNRDLWSPERILETLGLAEADLGLLKALGGRPRGWQPFEFARTGTEAGGLAALGLIRLSRWRRRVRLTEAGRILLLLTGIDPQIKKNRPDEGREKKD